MGGVTITSCTNEAASSSETYKPQCVTVWSAGLDPFLICIGINPASPSPTRCYNKTNGAAPLMHRVAPCHQDGLEMVPLGQVSPQCRGSDPDAGFQPPDGNRGSSPSQHSCCLIRNNENSQGDSTGDLFIISIFIILKHICSNSIIFL